MTDQQPRTAPFYHIPQRSIISIEHPAIVQNIDKAIDTLQGNGGIRRVSSIPKQKVEPQLKAQVLRSSDTNTAAYLRLRPEDAMCRPLRSTNTVSNNVVLKVTVPKRTGRKRKRGSDEPFTHDPSEPQQRRTAQQLLRSLQDNVGRYQVEPVGMVNRTHVFRGMPDFVYSTAGSAFSNRFREEILSFDVEKMKHFDLDMSKGAGRNADLIPPPSFSHGDIQFPYIYRQNPTVRQTMDTSGNITTINTQRAAKVLTHLVPYDIDPVPSQPRDSCPPMEKLDSTMRETITIIADLFAQRPAWTRRGLRNALPKVEQRYALRHAIPYVGYVFRSGPWRDAIVRFGHDPRTDPEYRKYQTLMFRILPREPDVARDGGGSAAHSTPTPTPSAAATAAAAAAATPGPTGGGRRHALTRMNEAAHDMQSGSEVLPTDTHIFRSKPPLPRDGRMWMFCDIEDPLLRRILFPEEQQSPSHQIRAGFLREKCDILSDGWYGNGTLAKAKMVMRAKILALLGEREADDADFAQLLTLPDHAASPEALAEGFSLDPRVASARDLMLATEVRSTIKSSAAWRAMVRGRGERGGGVRGGEDEGEDEDEGEYVEEEEAEEEAVEEAEGGEGEGTVAGGGGRRVQFQEGDTTMGGEGNEEDSEMSDM
ncbi:transcription factor TFIIIC subunit TFC1 [Aspergillus candidus]|uniref:RNA polymerase III transcription factor IIIC subunit-domain-containing protein n=1 Tax=Aspergillus candidus TaxID=41067 RepID=A0A2I2FNQ7_ASPCN|nr:RNA polymerase III transcription factor IIIC subunit-domain-containing protein [Aspergillus candidus]PLB42254.1 RNA polymerase III transcription factor IIIC subunit-domain-containing protein [Aspergillus candidus]